MYANYLQLSMRTYYYVIHLYNGDLIPDQNSQLFYTHTLETTVNNFFYCADVHIPDVVVVVVVVNGSVTISVVVGTKSGFCMENVSEDMIGIASK